MPYDMADWSKYMKIEDYELIWSDEFDYAGRPDADKWTFETGNHQWPNRELQAYSDRPSNVFVKDSCLHIRGIKEKDGEREYTSAKITTHDRASFKYGYFEFKVKLPRGLGSWPAIWMMPELARPKYPDWVPLDDNKRPRWSELTEEQREMIRPPEHMRWPNCGEIDIVEHIGRMENHLLFSLHCKNHNHANKATKPYTTNVAFSEQLCDDFHIYAMEWTEDYIEYFVDGKSYCRYNRSDDENTGFDSWPFDQPFFLIMNIAIGGGLGGPVTDAHLPFEMLVDYVRVYKHK